jgi:isopentenyldiphosphate isomerase
MDQEIFDIVDEEDKVIGKAKRSDVHKRGFIHKSVMFFIFDRQGKVFIDQRSYNKESYPDYWCIGFGGHVSSGETYEKAVAREAEEEAGVTSRPFFMGSFKKRYDENDKENVRVYGFIVDKAKQKIKLDPSEIKQGSFMSMKQLDQKLKKEKFLPETKDLYEILKRFKDKKIVKL